MFNELEQQYLGSPAYARAQQLLRDIGERTDFESVVIKSSSADVTLAELDATVGYDDASGCSFVKVSGTRGIKVATVLEQYCRMCHAIIPDDATDILWAEIAPQNL